VAKVFHRVLEHLDRFDPAKASVRGWVIGIARNAVIDHLRMRRDLVALDDAAELLAVVDPTPVGLDRRTEVVLAAVRELPAATREMLALHFGDGLRYREIAELTGGTEAAVKQRMARALRELRARVAEPVRSKGAAVHAV
jgi:RNA polymerase sigma-70 factor (ECF subfamily)